LPNSHQLKTPHMPFFRQKLKALQYPNSDNFNLSDQASYRHLVYWLEDNKIRFYKTPEEKKALSDLDNQNWDKHYLKYLEDVDCPKESNRGKNKPLNFNQKAIILEWLINTSIKDEFSKKANLYNGYLNKIQGETTKEEEKAKEKIQEVPSDPATYQALVTEIAQLLQVPPPSSPEEAQKLLLAIARYLERKMMICSTSTPSTQVNLKEFRLGFETGDPSLDSALTILRMLYVEDLRDLQSQINNMIVSAQNLTANPKTDTSLGRVGR